jgi:hypothetical protein
LRRGDGERIYRLGLNIEIGMGWCIAWRSGLKKERRNGIWKELLALVSWLSFCHIALHYLHNTMEGE